jgi:hypothetical protein
MAPLEGSNCASIWLASLFSFNPPPDYCLPFLGDILAGESNCFKARVRLIDEELVGRAVRLSAAVEENAINTAEGGVRC